MAAARAPALARPGIGAVPGHRPHVGEPPDEARPARELGQQAMAEIAAMRVVELHDAGVAQPGMGEDTAPRGIPEILQRESLRRLLDEAVGDAARAAAMNGIDVGILARLGADQHARAMAEPAQPLMDAARRSRGAAFAVRCRDVED